MFGNYHFRSVILLLKQTGKSSRKAFLREVIVSFKIVGIHLLIVTPLTQTNWKKPIQSIACEELENLLIFGNYVSQGDTTLLKQTGKSIIKALSFESINYC